MDTNFLDRSTRSRYIRLPDKGPAMLEILPYQILVPKFKYHNGIATNRGRKRVNLCNVMQPLDVMHSKMKLLGR